MRYDAAIVIPIHNEEKGIIRALDAFNKHITNRFLLVAIDNNSTDDTLKQLQKWQRTHPDSPFVILTESRRGSMYARRKGLLYAKDHASVVISSDADNTPREGFSEDVLTFLHNKNMDVLAGYQQQDPYARLLKQLYLPKLMDAVAWMEQIEREVFGPFFFGGYFGIKSEKITTEIFDIHHIAIPTEPSVIWSKHCHYSCYTFSRSGKTMQTSSRRFWADAKGFFALQHKKIIRSEASPSQRDVQRLEKLGSRENELITLRLTHFSQRLLLLLLDAIYFKRHITNTQVNDKAIYNAGSLLHIAPDDIQRVNGLSFMKAKKALTAWYGKPADKIIASKYRDFSRSHTAT